MNSIALGYAVFLLQKTIEIVAACIISCSFAQLLSTKQKKR
jgi:hypothetical protein